MHSAILATFFEISRPVVSMCSAGILLFVVALWAAKSDIAGARGLDKIVALSNLCFAVPLAGGHPSTQRVSHAFFAPRWFLSGVADEISGAKGTFSCPCSDFYSLVGGIRVKGSREKGAALLARRWRAAPLQSRGGTTGYFLGLCNLRGRILA